mgnify:FL=1
MIADTTFFIDLARRNPQAIAKLNELRERKESLAITSITTFELFQGSGNMSEGELRLFSRLIGNSLVIPVEHEAAQLAGMVKFQLSKKGLQVGPLDCLIAGVVIVGNDVLLTRNIKDFSLIRGLRLEAY